MQMTRVVLSGVTGGTMLTGLGLVLFREECERTTLLWRAMFQDADWDGMRVSRLNLDGSLDRMTPSTGDVCDGHRGLEVGWVNRYLAE